MTDEKIKKGLICPACGEEHNLPMTPSLTHAEFDCGCYQMRYDSTYGWMKIVLNEVSQ